MVASGVGGEGAIELIATCGFGLEAVVRRELEQLGYAARVGAPGHLQFEGDAAAICRANLWLRSADRVLVVVGSFEASDFDALFESTRQCGWERWLAPDAAFPVSGHSVHSQLSSVPACQRAVKKAIVSRLQSVYGGVELAETGPAYQVHLGLVNNRALLTLDTTGPSLHRRGYRQWKSRHPLKESLAAALVQLSFWSPGRPLIDPFCGSGTILIEAALLGRNLAPGRHRSFASEGWPQIPESLWRAARTEADDLQQPELSERILGMDIDEHVLKAARHHAELAGVAASIHFQPSPFARLTSKRRYGCILTNPPSGNSRETEALYRSIPEVLRKLPTWSHFFLTDFPEFEKLVGRAADRRRKLYHGRVQHTFYQFFGPKPPAAQQPPTEQPLTEQPPVEQPPVEQPPIEQPTPPHPADRAPRQPMPAAFGELTPKAREQAELFHRRLVKRSKHLRRWPTRQGITCFRLYERDIPEIPLVVDRYEDYLHITEYERPHDRDPALHANWLDLMARTAAKAVEIPPKQVFLKRRSRQRGDTQHQRVAEQHHEVLVQEGGLRFWVNLSDYVDTGLFLDHRITRSLVRDEAKGKRFLNLFAYTGAFTVYAADGAAAETTTVDWSKAYLEWAQRNMETNKFVGQQHRFVRSDAATFLSTLDPDAQFDLAVVDPPTFSNSKRTDQDWDVQTGYVQLLNDLLERMSSGGVIYFSNNFRRFKFDPEAIHAGAIHEISKQTVPPDYRNRRIHRCWRIVAD
ncbi:bifunctional 23S rRNA (guanine(2069)-N(7))-methyltransferase RlmK/23S rRNA (guanine(2445)-N(2))-methyltransferase RlmL [Candidatus Laterigemmans baculatus]|uniref:bifunctional 23S rRNA (guanine(2069)-N(7))-methyltransferase RlmK/23S rRNA (guanine(2445)-N(2))-methyltransferase RlmL n=1 Tax=Candidatus Laterigemmans baculatus TaxID=2770505 RepID=UPI0013DB385A|nr:bifunctional 23S rRNA (guanine(2069)-N(7))-methyltransferase RlmK/23S rRNA (guanine(2445)-N(2))-methyltransferase RlmL [Candidatus Laterigemmans baculatus]